MEAHIPTWLTYTLLYLAAAVIAVPISRALGLGSIIGYLVAGIIIGPSGLQLVSNVQDILHFSEFGVVLMLFFDWARAATSTLMEHAPPYFWCRQCASGAMRHRTGGVGHGIWY